MGTSSVYEQLRHRLTTCEFTPGQRLSPDALASRFGTSLSPVREALRQLASEGLLERIPNQGTFVRNLTRQQLSDLVEVRAVLECHAATVAAQRINEDELFVLRSHVEALESGYERYVEAYREKSDQLVAMCQDLSELDFEFHLGILRAAGNREVISILRNNHAMVRMFGFRTDPPQAWKHLEREARANCAVHREIYEAIAARQPEDARLAMISHNERARDNLFGRFDAVCSGLSFGEGAPVGDYSPGIRRRIEERLEE